MAEELMIEPDEKQLKIEPDMEFIRYLKSAGGDTLKKCYQCATCSAVCPLATDEKPFPRKEMIWAQWGMKDRLIADPDVFLCHHCGDCTAYCPRGAKPGEVLGAIRAYVYTHYGFPKELAKLATSAKNLPVLIGGPAFLLLVAMAVAGGLHIPDPETFKAVGFGHFFGHWDWPWLSKNVFFIDMIFVPVFFFAVYASYRGVSAMWKKMSEGIEENEDFRPSVYQYVVDFFWPAVVEIVQHKRFEQCGTNLDRVRGHLPLMYSFIGLLTVTVYSLVRKDFVGIFIPSLHGPIPLMDPFKLLANISAIAFIFGIMVLWTNRIKSEKEAGTSGTFYDWFLIVEIAVVGITGIGAEVARLACVPGLAYIFYYMHLVSVLMLFLYMPYTKFAHLIYRTAAMAFEKYRESGFVIQKQA